MSERAYVCCGNVRRAVALLEKQKQQEGGWVGLTGSAPFSRFPFSSSSFFAFLDTITLLVDLLLPLVLLEELSFPSH